MAKEKASSIPLGDFAPGRGTGVTLQGVLDLAVAAEGDAVVLIRSLHETYFPDSAPLPGDDHGEEGSLSWARGVYGYGYNVFKGMTTGAQLLVQDAERFELAPIAQQLVEASGKGEQILTLFAKHLLLNCKGLDVVTVAEDLAAGGRDLKKETVAAELNDRGLYVSPTSTDLNSLRQWLDEAGLVRSGHWHFDMAEIERLLDRSLEAIEALRELDRPIVAYAKTLALAGGGEHRSNDIRDLAEDLHGVRYDRAQLPKTVLEPLEERGLLTTQRGTGKTGKAYFVTGTDALYDDVALPLLEHLLRLADYKGLRELSRKPLAEIVADVRAAPEEKNRRGMGLEALALYLTKLLGLEFRGWRLRPSETQYGEVDAIVQGTNLLASRWQIQCKATTVVDTDVIAREIGLSVAIHSNAIVVVTTGRFQKSAYRLAYFTTGSTNLQVVLLDGKDLDLLVENPSKLAGLLKAQARLALRAKEEGLKRYLGET